MRTNRFNRRAFLRSALALATTHGVGDLTRALGQSRASDMQFVEGAKAAGIDFVLRNGAQGRKYQMETLPGGLGVIDFDGDGWPDLFCTNGAALPQMHKSGPEYWNRLYRNNRDGTFTDVTAQSGLAGEGYCMGVAVGDYDNDGREDLFVTGVHGNRLYRNNSDGSFTDVTAKSGLAGFGSLGRPAWTVAACWLDYDNDGNLDLFLSNYCDWSPGSDPVCGGMDAQSRTYCHPDKYKAQTMQLYRNNGDGTFSEVTRKDGLPDLLGKGMGIAMGDYNGNGHAGLFVANDNARNLLIAFDRKQIQETGLEAGVAYNGDGRNISGMGADFGDIDGNGLPDIVMTGLKNETFELFLNRGHGTFDDGSASSGLLNLSRAWSGWGCGLVDLDNDGWLDLFIAGGGLDTQDAQTNRIFLNDAAHHKPGHFIDISKDAGIGQGAPALHRGAVFADFDRDGRIDVGVTALNAPLEMWWNRTPRGNNRHWLQLRLTGTRSNRSAIGAVVSCSSGGRRQTRTVTSSVGYASSSDLTLQFGLGAANTAEIEIHWPSGIAQELGEVRADQRLQVTEPHPGRLSGN
jgi:hypothetical protein